MLSSNPMLSSKLMLPSNLMLSSGLMLSSSLMHRCVINQRTASATKSYLKKSSQEMDKDEDGKITFVELEEYIRSEDQYAKSLSKAIQMDEVKKAEYLKQLEGSTLEAAAPRPSARSPGPLKGPFVGLLLSVFGIIFDIFLVKTEP